jgi:tetratricopeptide (TPR) repeat protein
MVHMPAHIYARVGMWEQAAEANRKAIAADAAYFAQVPQQGFYRLYMMHNRHFLAYACMMEGRSQEALTAAREMIAAIPPEFITNAGPMIDGYLPVELEVLMRFGRWEEILAKKEPPAPLPISTCIWHMCRGVALANTGKLAEARAEQKLFLEARERVPADATVGNSPASTVLGVAEHVLAGEISFKAGAVDEAIASLMEAAKTEDMLRYDEPPNWMQPSRHILGAVLLSAGRAQDAGIVYRDDLSRRPENGWALFGLSEAIKAQLAPNYTKTLLRFRRAWEHADVQIDSSCACARPGNK